MTLRELHHGEIAQPAETLWNLDGPTESLSASRIIHAIVVFVFRHVLIARAYCVGMYNIYMYIRSQIIVTSVSALCAARKATATLETAWKE